MRDFFSEEIGQQDFFSQEVSSPRGNSSVFNVSEIAKPFFDIKSAISGTAPVEAAGIAYEQAKKPAIEGIKNPILKTLASLGIDVASGFGAEAGAGAIGRNLAKRAYGLVSKAEGLVPRLVPPEKGTIANQIQFGGEKSYQKNLAPFVKKSKDYEDLAGKFRQSETELSNQRQSIYKFNPQIADQPTMIDPALKTLTEAKNLGVVPGSKLEQMSKLITEQVDFLNNLPKEKRLNTQFVQDRKQAFQKMAENIYGEATAPDEKIAQQMYRDFAKANQQALETISPKIHPLNQKIAALIGGKKSAALLGEKASTVQIPSMLERLLSGTPFINKWFPINEAKKLALGSVQKQKTVPKLSGKIEGLMNRASIYEELENPSLVKTTLKQLSQKRKPRG